MQVNVNLAGLPAMVLPCGFVEGGPAGLPVGLQMIGAAFDEVLPCHLLHSKMLIYVGLAFTLTLFFWYLYGEHERKLATLTY